VRGLRQLIPRPTRPISTVGRLVDAAFGAAADQLSDRTSPLVGRGVQHVWVLRIHDQIGHAGVLADREDGLPRLAPVGGLVETTIAAG
jgi:hypothetical protein